MIETLAVALEFSGRDVMSVLSTAAIVMGGVFALAKWLWKRFEGAITEKLDSILEQTTATNGRVSRLESKVDAHTNRITRVEGILIGQGKIDYPEDY